MPLLRDRYFWLIALAGTVLLIPSLGAVPLWIYDEVRNAECAREMWERGDPIVPTFNGGLRTLKPVLHYYFMWLGFDIFGLGEWGARFFSALAGIATVLLTYAYTARFLDRLTAGITAALLLVSTHLLFEFRMSVPDPYLILFNALSIFTAYRYFTEGRLVQLLLSGAFFGLGLLTKGPVALALPGLAILVWLIWEGRWKRIFHWHLIPAAIVMLGLALPWYLAVHRATDGAWTRGFFLEHNVGRFQEPMEGHGGLFIIVPLFVLIGMLPGSAFFGESLRSFRQRMGHSFVRLSFCVTAVFMVFYAFSGTKLPNYPMPCYPFLAVVLAHFLQLGLRGEARTRRYPFFILLCLNILLPLGLYFGIRAEVETRGLEGHAVVAAVLTATAAASLFLLRRRGFRAALTSLLAGYTLFNLLFFNYLYPTIYNSNPLSKTRHLLPQYSEVVAYRIFHPSFTFYLPKRVPVIETADSLQRYLRGRRALIITREAHVPEIDSLKLTRKAAHHDLFEDHTTVLLASGE